MKKIINFLSKYFIVRYFNNNFTRFGEIYKSPFANIFNSTYSNQINIDGIYNLNLNLKLAKIIEKNLLEKNIFLDIGANIGDISIFYSKVFKKVTSLEPHPKIFKILNFNVEDIKNLETRNYGASEKDSILFQSKEFHNNFTTPTSNEFKENYYEVKGVKIDDFFDDDTLSKINFMNITIDGNELSALKGMPNFLNKKNLRLILLEAATDDKIKTCFNYLKNYDFKYIYYFPKSRDLIIKNFIAIFFDYFLKSNRNFKELNQNELSNDSLKTKYNKNVLFSKQKLIL